MNLISSKKKNQPQHSLFPKRTTLNKSNYYQLNDTIANNSNTSGYRELLFLHWQKKWNSRNAQNRDRGRYSCVLEHTFSSRFMRCCVPRKYLLALIPARHIQHTTQTRIPQNPKTDTPSSPRGHSLYAHSLLSLSLRATLSAGTRWYTRKMI